MYHYNIERFNTLQGRIKCCDVVAGCCRKIHLYIYSIITVKHS